MANVNEEIYNSKSGLPNKWLNPDGTYSTLGDILAGIIDVKSDIFVIVDELPASGDTQKIYIISDSKGHLVEYHWTGTKWDPIGMVEFNLSDYPTKEQVTAQITQALTDAEAYTDSQIDEKITQVLGGSY